MFERKASTFLAFSFLLLALLNTAFSISAAISPAITTYKFTTEKITGTFNVINTDVTQGEMTAISNSPYVTVTSEKVFSITPGGSYPVTYEVNLPEDFPPGTTRIFITATKAPDQGGNVGIAVAFNYVIKIEKPYPDKFVEATGPSVEISGKKVTLEVTATNKGSEPIDSAKAKIKIFDSEKNVLDNVESGEKALPLDSATGLKMVWTAPKTGIYPFEALVE
ncbi:cadherin repeat domain-containing protein, partial [Candidatus Parvarchaeota archaeon]|nr:cadherin repeat domain-containing protein [Candidatus Parvarchaeota archaeon]